MKIEFIKSPTGAFRLAYSIGDTVDIKDEDLCAELIERKYAIEVKEEVEEVEEEAGSKSNQSGSKEPTKSNSKGSDKK